MKSQACEPCAKRKVRCDKGEPCSNCKRRKRDHCIYPEASPLEKIKRLEALVRSLGGDPENEFQKNGDLSGSVLPSAIHQSRSKEYDQNLSTVTNSRGKDAVILEEDGKAFYLES